MAHSTRTMVTLDVRDLEKIIRKIVRRDVRQVVREELARTGAEVIEPWMSDPESPLYQDMLELQNEVRSGRRPKLLTYEEVFGK
ncbi:MAG: hypothetical protein L0Y55_17180 [Anaerolineales bacterium]|nr:hypothetical protein [Anaerolineales bacterium]